MKVLTMKTLGIGGGLATVTGGGITVAYLSSDDKETKTVAKDQIQEAQSIDQSPTEDDVTRGGTSSVQEPQAITELLKNAGYEIPTKEADKSKWASQWSLFKEKYKNTQLPTTWTIDGWDDIKNNEDAPEKYKEKCISNGQQKIAEAKGEIFEAVKKYCATTATLSG